MLEECNQSTYKYKYHRYRYYIYIALTTSLHPIIIQKTVSIILVFNFCWFSIRVSSLGSSYIVSHKLVLLRLALVSRYSLRNALIVYTTHLGSSTTDLGSYMFGTIWVHMACCEVSYVTCTNRNRYRYRK